MLTAYSVDGTLPRGAKKELIQDIKKFIGLTSLQKRYLINCIKALCRKYSIENNKQHVINWKHNNKFAVKCMNKRYYSRHKRVKP